MTDLRFVGSEHRDPINLGQDRMISINELVDIVSGIAGKRVHRVHNLDAPQGVRLTIAATVELEGSAKPACVAEQIALLIKDEGAQA